MYLHSWADPEGGQVVRPPPWKITSNIGSIGIYKQLDPPRRSWTPQGYIGPPLDPWKMKVFFESNHWTSVK